MLEEIQQTITGMRVNGNRIHDEDMENIWCASVPRRGYRKPDDSPKVMKSLKGL